MLNNWFKKEKPLVNLYGLGGGATGFAFGGAASANGHSATGGIISDYEQGGETWRAHIFYAPGNFNVTELGEIDDTVEGGSELAQLRAEKDKILAKFKSGEISMDQYKEEIGDIPAKIKALEKKMAADLDVEEDDDEMINESLVHMFQKRAGLLNG